MKKYFGFTLIEVLVASTIVIVLASIGMASFSSGAKTSRDAKRKADMEAIRQAFVLYRSSNGNYSVSNSFRTNPTTNGLITGGYLSAPFPTDPRAGSTNQNGVVLGYSAVSIAEQSFCICAPLETPKGNSTANNCSNLSSTSGWYYCAKNP